MKLKSPYRHFSFLPWLKNGNSISNSSISSFYSLRRNREMGTEIGNMVYGQFITLCFDHSFLSTLLPCSRVGSFPRERVLHELSPCDPFTQAADLPALHWSRNRLLQCGYPQGHRSCQKICPTCAPLHGLQPLQGASFCPGSPQTASSRHSHLPGHGAAQGLQCGCSELQEGNVLPHWLQGISTLAPGVLLSLLP